MLLQACPPNVGKINCCPIRSISAPPARADPKPSVAKGRFQALQAGADSLLRTRLGYYRPNVIGDTQAVNLIHFPINATDDANRDVNNAPITPIHTRF